MPSPEQTHGYTEDEGAQLVDVARHSIVYGLADGVPLPLDLADYPPALRAERASFVTLRKRGALRGCIGSLEASRALVLDVAENAFKSAFRDPRFPPLGRFEVESLDVSISVLSPLEPFPATSEDDLIARLRPRIDGLVLREGTRQSTFLPAVWESLPEPRAFVRELKRKAGLAENFWSESLEIRRYTVDPIC